MQLHKRLRSLYLGCYRLVQHRYVIAGLTTTAAKLILVLHVLAPLQSLFARKSRM